MTARPPTPLKPLLRRGTADRSTWWTRALGSPPALHGEHVVSVGGASYRQWETARSKLAAAIAKGWSGPLPASGERWLYLGAASGTTASHVADLVGESGSVFGVEKSPRPFLRLLQAAERYPNLFPVLADARTPEAYAALVPPVDGLYMDLAQADQPALILANARLFLRGGGKLLLALKTSSMGRTETPATALARAERVLMPGVDLTPSLLLEPFHRRHYLMGGRARGALFRDDSRTTDRPNRRVERES